MSAAPHDVRVAKIDLTADRRLTVWHRRGEHRCRTEIAVEVRGLGDIWKPARSISVPHGVLWLLRDALDGAVALASKERR